LTEPNREDDDRDDEDIPATMATHAANWKTWGPVVPPRLARGGGLVAVAVCTVGVQMFIDETHDAE